MVNNHSIASNITPKSDTHIPLNNCIKSQSDDSDDTHLTAIFQNNLGKPVLERLHSGLYWTKDDARGSNNCTL